MDAAVDLAALLNAVPDNPALAMRTDRCERVDSALEAVKGVMLAGYDHFECFVIFIFADFTCGHTIILSHPTFGSAVSIYFLSEIAGQCCEPSSRPAPLPNSGK